MTPAPAAPSEGLTDDGLVGDSQTGAFRWIRFGAVLVLLCTAVGLSSAPVAANEAPSVSVQYTPDDPAVNDTVTFQASAADPDGDPLGYEWFVDGESIGSGDEQTHTFESGGSHTVRVSVSDGQESTPESVTVDVSGDSGGLSVTIDHTPTRPRAGTTITFEADASTTVSSYVWRFGDGVTGSGPFASHSYDEPGTYTVELVAEDEESRATDTVEVEVSAGTPGTPRVDVDHVPEDPSVGERVTFEASARDSDGTVERYNWTVDGTPVDAGKRLRTTFDEPGTHDVSVTVTDNAGLTASTTTTVDVADDNVGPTATIDYDPVSPNAGESVTLTANARDSDGSVASYDWVVDGESAGRGESVTHTFDEEGDATVRLTVTDDDGASVTAETSFGVGPAVDTENDDAENASDGSNGGGGEGLPGFTVVAVLAALAALTTAAFVRRR